METIYLVAGRAGQYDDAAHWPARAFGDQLAAIEYADQCNYWAKHEWREHHDAWAVKCKDWAEAEEPDFAIMPVLEDLENPHDLKYTYFDYQPSYRVVPVAYVGPASEAA